MVDLHTFSQYASGMKNAPTTGRVGEAIAERIAELGMSVKDLADQMPDFSYEHIRRLVRGGHATSVFMIRQAAEILKMDVHYLERLNTEDQLYRKHGPAVIQQLAGKKPGMEGIERVWDNLTQAQQRDIVVMAQGWAKNNARDKAHTLQNA